VPALERLAQTFSEGTGIEVQLESQLGDERLAEEIETTLYRLVQEALTNVVKHAHARTVSILLVRRNDRVTAIIEDDGRGFDPSQAREDGLGLVGMRERVGLVGGKLTVEASEGAGTTIAVEVPAS
jgi:signal transduction histidine kinase